MANMPHFLDISQPNRKLLMFGGFLIKNVSSIFKIFKAIKVCGKHGITYLTFSAQKCITMYDGINKPCALRDFSALP